MFALDRNNLGLLRHEVVVDVAGVEDPELLGRAGRRQRLVVDGLSGHDRIPVHLLGQDVAGEDLGRLVQVLPVFKLACWPDVGRALSRNSGWPEEEVFAGVCRRLRRLDRPEPAAAAPASLV